MAGGQIIGLLVILLYGALNAFMVALAYRSYSYLTVRAVAPEIREAQDEIIHDMEHAWEALHGTDRDKKAHFSEPPNMGYG